MVATLIHESIDTNWSDHLLTSHTYFNSILKFLRYCRRLNKILCSAQEIIYNWSAMETLDFDNVEIQIK